MENASGVLIEFGRVKACTTRDSGVQAEMCFDFPRDCLGDTAVVMIGGRREIVDGKALRVREPVKVQTRSVGVGRPMSHPYPSSRVRVLVPPEMRGCPVVVVVLHG